MEEGDIELNFLEKSYCYWPRLCQLILLHSHKRHHELTGTHICVWHRSVQVAT